MTTTATAQAAYRVRGTTDDVTTCQICGKPELRGTVVLDILDADGNTEDIMGIEPLEDKFAAFRWKVQRVDGHDLDALLDAFSSLEAEDVGAPHVIIADTVKGRGVGRMEGDVAWHVGNLNGSDYEEFIAELQAGLRPIASGARNG